MKIIWFEDSYGYHKIDQLDHELVKRGHKVETHQVFSKAVAQSGNVCWVEVASGLAIDASSHKLSVPLIIRGSAMEFYRKGFNRIKWENVDAFLVQGQHLKDWVMENWKQTPRDKISVFPSAIDTEYFSMRKNPKRGDLIALVSQFHWRKGTQLIPEVLQAIPDKYIVRHIGHIIDWDCWNYVHDEIRRLKLKDRYWYDGTTGNVPKWLEDKTYFLLPSYTEGMPRACGEAMSMGLKPMIHYYRGADKQWPEKYIWRKPEEVAEMLKGGYWPREYRSFIEDNRSLGIVAEKAEELMKGLVNEKN